MIKIHQVGHSCLFFGKVVAPVVGQTAHIPEASVFPAALDYLSALFMRSENSA